MTDFTVTASQGAMHRPDSKRSNPKGEPQHPFSHVLDMIDRELTRDDRRPFGGGTMHAIVEPFGALGLLGAGAPVAPRDGATGRKPPAEAWDQNGTPVHLVATDPASEAHAYPALQAQGAVGAEAGASHAGRNATDAPREQAWLAASDDRSSAAGIAKPPPLPNTGTNAPPRMLRSEVAAPRSVPTARLRADPQASALKVALEMDEAGVTVSVIGAPLEAGEQTMLSRAVTRLLARHGLVLSALHVGRRQAGRQEGER